MGDNRSWHPPDLSSRGLRRGAPRGRGNDSSVPHGPDGQGPKGPSHPFINNLSSRGFKTNALGRNESRDPRWGGPSDEPPQGRGRDEPHGKLLICLSFKLFVLVWYVVEYQKDKA